MRILLVDDEQPAIERLSRLVQEIGGYSIVGTAHTGEEAVKKAHVLKPDIIILDIRMPIMDGIEAARHISGLEPTPAVIFSTAFDDYALDAYGVQASDYILKPVSKTRLTQALQRAITPNQALLNHMKTCSNQSQRQFISARAGKHVELIPVESIYYFIADQKYVRIVHRNGEVLIEEPLKSLEAEFNDSFVRIHRNAIVALHGITKLEKADSGHLVYLRDIDHPLDVSRRCLPELKRQISRLGDG